MAYLRFFWVVYWIGSRLKRDVGIGLGRVRFALGVFCSKDGGVVLTGVCLFEAWPKRLVLFCTTKTLVATPITRMIRTIIVGIL